MNIVLSGPMTGLPYFNAEAFNDAAEFLREQGHEVFSPVEAAIARYGAELIEGNPSGDERIAKMRHGFDRRAALFDTLQCLCTWADAIGMIPAWEASSGARPEWETARALNLNFIYL